MIRTVLRKARPLLLLINILMYTLGVGVAGYLGGHINYLVHGIGVLAVMSIISASNLLDDYFNHSFLPLETGETPRQREKTRILILQISFVLFSLSLLCFLLLLLHHDIKTISATAIVIFMVLSIILGCPPFLLTKRGFGEVVIAINTGALVPVIAFTLQSSEIHKLLMAVCFPLILIIMASLIIRDYETYSEDRKNELNSFLIRMGITGTAQIHHTLILCAFLLFAIAPVLRIPWRLIWPVFLSIPFFILQIVWLQTLINGGKIRINQLSLLAGTSVCLAIIFLSFTFLFF
jgi:1,4-dihydroxy-2-naphthoate octaprenyltransferase